jgi:Ca2+-binding RTX toxin-like protein
MSGQRPGRGGLLWVIAFACLLGVCVIAPAVAFSAEEEPAPAPAEAGSSLPVPDETAVSETLAEALQAHRQQLAQRAEALAAPDAVAARQASQQAYANLDRAGAEELLRSVFGPVLEELNQDPARFLSDATVERVAGDEGAVVTSEGETQLLETNVPVQAEEAGGELGQIDVTLAPSAEGWEPENPLVELEIGRSAEEGIEVGDEGLTVTQAGAGEAVATPLGDKSLFYSEVTAGEDMDQVVAPISGGVEIFNLLRSVDSPESLRFSLELPAGSQLRAGPGGSAEVVGTDGGVSALIPKPWALDAQGTQVPVEMSVEGSDLVLAVPHRDQDLAYPILVDPTIYQDWDSWYLGSGLGGLAGWRWQQNDYPTWLYHGTSDPSGFPGYEGKGLFAYTAPATMTGQHWGQWIYSAPNPGSYLASATVSPFTRNNRTCPSSSYYYPYDYAGMWKEASGWAQIKFNNANDFGSSTQGTWGEALILGLSTDAATNTIMPCARSLMIGGVGIWLDDWQVPWMTILVPFSTSWMKKDATPRTVEVKGTDMGLGVQKFRLAAGAKEWTWDQPYCAGTYEDRCATERTGKITYTTEGVGAEGKVNVSLQVIDPTDKRGTVERTLAIDGTAPTLAVVPTTTSSGRELAIEAKDGNATEPRSGVKEVKVYLDGVLKETKASSCTSAGCPEAVSFTYSQPNSGLTGGSHTLEVVATDQVGYTKAWSTTFSLTGPSLKITSGPEGSIKTGTATFGFAAQAGATVNCSVDTGTPTWGACSTATSHITTKPQGSYTFRVRATDSGGIQTIATRPFSVDLTAPETTIVSGPEGQTHRAQPRFTYSSNESGAGFECRIDAAAFSGCDDEGFEPSQALADGAHTFYVRAVDPAGNLDATPAGRAFTVDSVSPSLKIESGPSGPTKLTKPVFGFSVPAGATLKCAIDADAGFEEPTYVACAGPTYEPAAALAQGAYTFRVMATETSGNITVDSRQFTVDTVAPETTIASGPTGRTEESRPLFGFSSNETTAGFECRFDAEAFRACSGPGAADKPPLALANGNHTFSVRAKDGAGNTDLTPASRAFSVDTTAPQTTIKTAPAGISATATPKFEYTTSGGLTFECRIDAAAFASCPTTGYTPAALTQGTHTFAVRAVNSSGNTDPTPAEVTFVVDTTAPTLPLASGDLRNGSPGVDLHVEVQDGDATSAGTIRSGVKTINVYVDGQIAYSDEMPCVGAQQTCPDKLVRDLELPYQRVIGIHSYKVVGIDALGRPGPALEWWQAIPTEGTVEARVKQKTDPDCTQRANKSGVRYNAATGVVRGTSGADLIVGGEDFEVIFAGAGCDVIIGGLGPEKIHGEGDPDLIRGGRSNDHIWGDGGADTLYGGIGDDEVFGQSGNDRVDGGPGADEVLGEQGDDTVRGGQGRDKLAGGADNDTLSYADALMPGYSPSETDIAEGSINRFPDGEPGVYINMKSDQATGDNGPEGRGGGVDYLYLPRGTAAPGNAAVATRGSFEEVVGSAFSDVIEVGAGAGLTEIDGGPGADVILGAGTKTIYGGSDGDYLKGTGQLIGPDGEIDRCTGSASISSCTNTEEAIRPRSSKAITVGFQRENDGDGEVDMFLSGSDEIDKVATLYNPNSHTVTFTRRGGGGTFTARGSDCQGGGSSIRCRLGKDRILGALVISGGNGEDELSINQVSPQEYGAISLNGGFGRDVVHGNLLEELVVDGVRQGAPAKPDKTTPKEQITSGGGDDAVVQGDGPDHVRAGDRHDLLLSSSICERDDIDGDGGRDNAQFHATDRGVFGDVASSDLGHPSDNSNRCPAYNEFDPLRQVEDLEGSPERDVFRGDGAKNLLIGRGGPDSLLGRAGADVLNSRDGHKRDRDVNCGGQPQDLAHIDIPEDKPAVSGCKNVDQEGENFPDREAGNNSLSRMIADASLNVSESSDPADAPMLTGEYTLSETEGTEAENLVESSEDGTYEAAGVGPATNDPGPTLQAAGALIGEVEDPAVELDGSEDFIQLAEEGEAVEAADGYSVELLVQFDAAPSEREYLFANMDEGKGPYLFRGPDGRIVFGSNTAKGNPKVMTTEPVADEQWHQVVGTLEGDDIALYVDGFPYRVGYGQSVLPEEADAPETLVGASPGMTYFLDGSVDEVSTYEGALSEGEVIEHLTASKAEEPETLLAPEPETSDVDSDGVTDGVDNCVQTSNGSQEDEDLSGIGDACLAPDGDGDEVPDAGDNCLQEYNPDQADANGDGLGDACAELPPVTFTSAATAVKSSSATLQGTVNPGAQATTYRFEYGKTETYGSFAPIFPKSVGAGVTPVAANVAVSGLAPNTTYHYRLTATNASGTSEGADQTFTTPSVGAEQLSAMAVTEPFDGSANSLANYSAKWTQLCWATGKGEDTTSGWAPVNAFPTVYGASYSPALYDSGAGVAAVATMATNPGVTERYFSLWLDVPNPAATTRSGYELRFLNTASNTYTVTLSKWLLGTQTVLGSKTGVAFVNGNSFAIVDEGANVSAWADTGAGFTQLLTAADSTFASGSTGLEAAGNGNRLTKFKAGALLSPVANMNQALKALPVRDAFTTEESPLAGGGAWTALSWDNSTSGHNTGWVSGGWGPWDAHPTVNGAYWQKATFADTGSGAAVAATLNGNATIAGRHFALLLNMPAPGTAKAGYEVRFTETSGSVYEVSLSKWQAGTKTATLASKASHSFAVGGRIALVEKGGTVSVWTAPSPIGEFTQLMSGTDTTFTSGFTGMEAAGNIIRLGNFAAGPLAPF